MDITEIFTNPLVWGLLAWLFSRLFTSNKKEEDIPKKQPNRQQNGPGSRPNPRPGPNPKPVMTTVEQKTRKEEKPTLQTVQQAYEKMKNRGIEQFEHVEIVKEEPKKRTFVKEESIERIPTVKRNVKRNQLIVDRQKAVQGVIWSEILGAPRSKNPHYTRNRRHS